MRTADEEITWAMQKAHHDALVMGADDAEAIRAAWEAAKAIIGSSDASASAVADEPYFRMWKESEALIATIDTRLAAIDARLAALTSKEPT